MKTRAEIEFDILEAKENDAIILPFKEEILALINKFMKSGQSGGSAPYTIGAIADAVKRLGLHQPLYGITGEDGEWTVYNEKFEVIPIANITKEEIIQIKGDLKDDRITIQNNRLSSVFKDEKGAYYLDAIVFEDDGIAFTSNSVKLKDGSTISSRQYIKEFPFFPKTFYVDVIEIDDESFIKNESQLDEIYDYYKKV